MLFSLNTILMNMPGYIYWLDENLIILGCNDNFLKLVGASSHSEIVGKQFYDFTQKAGWNSSLIDQFVRENLDVITTGVPRIDVEDPPIIDTDGKQIYLLTNRSPLPNAENQTVGVITLSIDITARKLAEAMILESKQRVDQQRNTAQIYLENILTNFPAYVYWKDQNCVILGCNDRLAKSVGFAKAADIIGKTDYDLSWKEQADSIEKNDRIVMDTGMPIIVEETGKLADGTVMVSLSHKAPMYNKDGAIIGTIGISIDITDRKVAELREKTAIKEAAEAKVKALAEQELCQAVMVLTGSIVHDLRTPIATIHITAENLDKNMPLLLAAYHEANQAKLIQGESLKPRYVNFLQTAAGTLNTTAKRMNEFIDVSLKTLSKTLTNDLTKEDLVICSIDHCVTQTIHSYPFTGDEAKLIHWDRQYDFSFSGNAVLMIRILSNLIKNSLYQINKNQIGEVYISTSDNCLNNILRVKDTAGGAAPNVAEHLFDGYKTNKKEGTGVGLAFCKKIMHDFGGDITSHSVYGEYIEFILEFPKINAAE